MPRELCVGNGNFQVNFDNDMNIRDVFFPFVGLENHVSGHFCRFGVWVDGRFSWINASWDKRFRYKKDSLVACMHEESEKKTVSRTMKLKKTEKAGVQIMWKLIWLAHQMRERCMHGRE